MPNELAVPVFAVALTLMVLVGAAVIWRYRRRESARVARGLALDAATVIDALGFATTPANLLYSVTLGPSGGRGMWTLVRDGDGQDAGRVGFPVANGGVIRTISCEEGDYACHRIFGMSGDRVSLQRAGSDAIRMQFEAGAGVERYRINGEVVYERRPLSPMSPGRWRIESRGETVAVLVNLAADLDLRAQALIAQGELPLVDRLFILAMSDTAVAAT
ncbi:MAG: hypothetical protein KDH20_07755 [Rhodocyclaceae bacterium]|nr:hypothetical protein [Rhodocyclaceae bacterium]